MLTVTLVLLVAAFVVAVLAGLGRAPLWVAVLLLAITGLLGVLPR
jgi:hypothetical protein